MFINLKNLWNSSFLNLDEQYLTGIWTKFCCIQVLKLKYTIYILQSKYFHTKHHINTYRTQWYCTVHCAILPDAFPGWWRHMREARWHDFQWKWEYTAKDKNKYVSSMSNLHLLYDSPSNRLMKCFIWLNCRNSLDLTRWWSATYWHLWPSWF